MSKRVFCGAICLFVSLIGFSAQRLVAQQRDIIELKAAKPEVGFQVRTIKKMEAAMAIKGTIDGRTMDESQTFARGMSRTQTKISQLNGPEVKGVLLRFERMWLRNRYFHEVGGWEDNLSPLGRLLSGRSFLLTQTGGEMIPPKVASRFPQKYTRKKIVIATVDDSPIKPSVEQYLRSAYPDSASYWFHEGAELFLEREVRFGDRITLNKDRLQVLLPKLVSLKTHGPKSIEAVVGSTVKVNGQLCVELTFEFSALEDQSRMSEEEKEARSLDDHQVKGTITLGVADMLLRSVQVEIDLHRLLSDVESTSRITGKIKHDWSMQYFAAGETMPTVSDPVVKREPSVDPVVVDEETMGPAWFIELSVIDDKTGKHLNDVELEVVFIGKPTLLPLKDRLSPIKLGAHKSWGKQLRVRAKGYAWQTIDLMEPTVKPRNMPEGDPRVRRRTLVTEYIRVALPKI